MEGKKEIIHQDYLSRDSLEPNTTVTAYKVQIKNKIGDGCIINPDTERLGKRHLMLEAGELGDNVTINSNIVVDSKTGAVSKAGAVDVTGSIGKDSKINNAYRIEVTDNVGDNVKLDAHEIDVKGNLGINVTASSVDELYFYNAGDRCTLTARNKEHNAEITGQ